MQSTRSRRTLAKFTPWYLGTNLVYCFLVILWGALVRATGSGAGCGASWPLCHGEFIPPAAVSTMIEFTHRAMSGLLLVTILGGVFLSFRCFQKHHPCRAWSLLCLLFVMIEAGIGAMLVLLELVGENPSAIRAYVMGAHLINTFLLLATQWIHFISVVRIAPGIGQLGKAVVKKPVFVSCVCLLLLVSASGAMVALGDTLFPVDSLAEGFWQAHMPQAHFLVKLRKVHPFLAIATSLILVIYVKNILTHSQPVALFLKRLAVSLVIATIGQLLFGVLNWILLVPLWSQLVHLALALILWLLLVAIGIEDMMSAPSKNPQMTKGS
ncbi:MAG: COX15/CtaA family protein [Proteobacteria bacterium]|nr:COX15/CtaA family protein [Pseudomonadota bacterium]